MAKEWRVCKCCGKRIYAHAPNEPYDDEAQRQHDEASILLHHEKPIGHEGQVYRGVSSWKGHPKVGDVVKTFTTDGTRLQQTAVVVELLPDTYEWRFRIVEDHEQLSLF